LIFLRCNVIAMLGVLRRNRSRTARSGRVSGNIAMSARYVRHHAIAAEHNDLG
jgi:hypothetical protein